MKWPKKISEVIGVILILSIVFAILFFIFDKIELQKKTQESELYKLNQSYESILKTTVKKLIDDETSPFTEREKGRYDAFLCQSDENEKMPIKRWQMTLNKFAMKSHWKKAEKSWMIMQDASMLVELIQNENPSNIIATQKAIAKKEQELTKLFEKKTDATPEKEESEK